MTWRPLRTPTQMHMADRQHHGAGHTPTWMA
jgi:hypothetical protein